MLLFSYIFTNNGFFQFLKRFYLFIFRKRRRKGKREGKKHQYVVASCIPPTEDLVHNPDMCPDGELNQQPFGLQANTHSTELHQPGLINNGF